MRKSLQILAMLFSIALVSPAIADNTTDVEDESGTVRTATIRGRVLDTERNILTGAVIYIEDLNVGAVSDVNGYYTITNVTPGEHSIEVSYIGYEAGTTSVLVESGETLQQEILLGMGSTQMDEVVVSSVMQGQHRAINSQKNALNLLDVVSADQAGKYPDSNIGDALKRISGINVQYDQGEARFGQVRGTPADMSSVTINGNRLPSAEGETRSVQLDLIPSDMIQTIEVSKVVTPDMDADAIGGSINLVTKNSPTRRVLSATVGSGYNVVSERAQANVAATYGDIIGDKFGYVLSASYQNAPIGSDNVEYEYDLDDNGNGYMAESQIRQYFVQRQRQSYSAAFNWDINKNHKINFNSIYNRRHDWENRYRQSIKDISSEANADGSYTAEKVRFQTKGGDENANFSRLELQQTMDFSLSGEHLFGKVMANWGASYAYASEDRPGERYVGLQTKGEDKGGVDYYIDYSKENPVLTTVGDELVINDSYSIDELAESNQVIYEKDLKFNVNFAVPVLAGQYASTLKFGGKFTSKDKFKEVVYKEYEPIDEDQFLIDATSSANSSSQTRDNYMAGDFKVGTFTNREFLGGLDFDSNDYTGGELLEEMAENFDAHENVASAYIRYDQKLGSKLDMMVGARLENTSVEYSGYAWDVDNDTLDETGTSSKSYMNILPSVMFKYDANDRLKLRAAFTNTIARPDYADLVPSLELERDGDDVKVKVGNPDLEATISYNADLFADYYFNSIGLVRGGLFYKKIEGFLAETTINDYNYNGKVYDKFTQSINAGNAVLMGGEISLSRDFGFISPSLRCFGFAGTYTYTYSDVTELNIEDRENEKMALAGSPKHTANASIYFEKSGLTARVSYNYASEFLDELGDSAFFDRYYDSVNYLDLNLSYNFKKYYTIYADATNLLNQPLRYYQGTKEQTMQSEYYGIRCNIGIKMNF